MDNLAIITKRVDYYDYYFVIVPDIAAGRTDRYTVYRLPTSGGVTFSLHGDPRVKVLGRELPLGHSKEIVRKAAAEAKKAIKEIVRKAAAEAKKAIKNRADISTDSDQKVR